MFAAPPWLGKPSVFQNTTVDAEKTSGTPGEIVDEWDIIIVLWMVAKSCTSL